MNRPVLAFISIVTVFLGSTILLSCSKKSNTTQPPLNYHGPSSLHVPFRPQIADNLCWAACTEMVSMYYHDSITNAAPIITQCMAARNLYDSLYACNCDTITSSNFPSEWNQPSIPFPPNAELNQDSCFGYVANTYYGHGTPTPDIMTSDTLYSYISNKIPVIFGWYYEGITIASVSMNGIHFMVAEGVPHSSYISHLWIRVNDPWPTNKGLRRIMAYSEYANQFPPSIAGSKQCVFSGHNYDFTVTKYPGQQQ